jgi:hypothetical protein
VVMPKYVQSRELAHTVLTKGQPVLAAGEAEIAGAQGQYVGIEINNHTGHYLTSTESLQIAREAFAKLGVYFP